MLSRFLLVALGSALGGVLRFGVSLLSARWWGASYPYGTLIVNLLGSFSIALVAVIASLRGAEASEGLVLFLMVGVFGGLTTYSAFNEQTLSLLREAGPAMAATNVATTLLGCLAAGLLGAWAGKLLAG